MGRHRVRRAGYSGWLPFLCAIAAIAALATAAISWVTAPNWGRNDVVAAPRTVGTVPAQTPSVAGSPVAHSLLTPKHLEIPALSVSAPIVRVGTQRNGALQVPRDPKTTGWWGGGANPGAPTGTAVIAGHINYSGVTGALAQIGELDPGDVVYVDGLRDGSKTRVPFTITGVRTYLKHGLPYQTIFNQDVAGRLVLITCGGPFDASTGNYRDNIVAYAVPA